ncbi:glucose-6-phosphate 1-epimerase [Acinetobacter sp. DSM 11652]|nr:glucose-6-phosphate 1-epimerase [Acinetobacter sp. DSM 11652]
MQKYLVKLENSELEAIQISNLFCEALISLHGAQVLKFHSKKCNKDLLWLSDLAKFETGKAIRGGIPLCFPWFGGHPTDANLPAHGFARNSLWQLKDITEDTAGHHVLIELTDTAATRQLWNYAFKLQMLIHCGEELKLEFKLQNLDQHAFEFTFAWHSYFPVVTQHASVLGLQDTHYIDQLDENKVKTQTSQGIEFTAETDRVYPKTSGKFIIQQNGENHIQIQSTAKSAVVWNPWIKKAERLADVANDAWQEFICVETGQIASEKVSLDAGETVQYQLSIATA